MITIGLTGSIGMGKSTTADMFKADGVPVFDADACVQALYAPDGAAFEKIAKLFPKCCNVQNGVDKQCLSKTLQDNPSRFKDLEAIVHPLVAKARQDFVMHAQKQSQSIILFDVPLLLETHQNDQVDVVIVVSADEKTQKQRVLARPGMSEEKLQTLLDRQIPDHEKQAQADFVIDTSHGLDHARKQVRDILKQVKDRVDG